MTFSRPPEPVRVRLARPDDAAALARLHVETWREAYRGQVAQAYLDSLDEDERRRRWELGLAAGTSTTFVAEDASGLVGFCTLAKARDDDAQPQVGEIAAIYVQASRWRSGIGSELMQAAESRARSEGFSELTLWVLDTNRVARCFYEKHGFRLDGAEKVELRGSDVSLSQLRYRR